MINYPMPGEYLNGLFTSQHRSHLGQRISQTWVPRVDFKHTVIAGVLHSCTLTGTF